jgi:acyl carrier protein
MISEKLQAIICKELELEDFEMVDATTAGEVPGWDSLNHVKIISAVEAGYGIRFKTAEVIRLRNVGELQALVSKKTGS